MSALLRILINLFFIGVFVNSLSKERNIQQYVENILGSGVNISEIDLASAEFAGEKCSRECVISEGRICYYKFVLEHYNAMGGACGDCAKGVEKDCDHPQCVTVDGVEKGVMSINRKIPGPLIQVCKGDLIVVDVSNMASGTAATIHWHGLHMYDTPYMDGVPFVTQCPIEFSTTFRYTFWASQAGTQFYHSHSGHHKMSGQYGGLVIREPTIEDPHNKLYDYDLEKHVIVMSDWMHAYPEMFFPGLPTRPTGIQPNSVLINDRGQHIDPMTNVRTGPPPNRYYVKAGYRYRFRYINSGNHACPKQLQIEGHNLTVIATDSYNVLPKIVSTIVNNAGERYDFVIDANQPPGDYFIRIRALEPCDAAQIESFAVLSYFENSTVPKYPLYDETFPDGIVLNKPDVECFTNESSHCITELESLSTDKELRDAIPDQQLYLGFAMQSVNESYLFNQRNQYPHFMNLYKRQHLMGTVNGLSHTFPPFPPLTQPEQLNQIQFCDKFNIPESCNGLTACPCIHRIKLKLNSVVELIIVDESEGGVYHPFHLHGVNFMVTYVGANPLGIPLTAKLAEDLDKKNLLPRKFNSNPPLKDTVTIPSTGYAITRFKAYNPGYWMMHCHYEWHLAAGMGLFVQVGEPEDMVKPPTNFPKCGNYIPNLENIF